MPVLKCRVFINHVFKCASSSVAYPKILWLGDQMDTNIDFLMKILFFKRNECDTKDEVISIGYVLANFDRFGLGIALISSQKRNFLHQNQHLCPFGQPVLKKFISSVNCCVSYYIKRVMFVCLFRRSRERLI
jgi:hypothetical protein